MQRIDSRYFPFIALMFILIAALTGFAQNTQEGFSNYGDIIEEMEGLKGPLLWKRNITMGLAFLVGFLGLATATLQKVKKPWTKTFTIAAGFFVGLLTLSLNTFFSGDHRDYGRSLATIENSVHNVRRLVLELRYAGPEEKREIELEIREKVRDCYESLEGKLAHSVPSFSLVTAAYAFQEGLPPNWIDRRRYSDNNSLYFVGIDSSTSITGAKSGAYEDAVLNAVDAWTETLGKAIRESDTKIDVNALTNLIVESASVHDTYFVRRDDGQLVYYTLIRISKKLSDVGLDLYGIENEVAIPTSVRSAVTEVDFSTQPYLSRRLKARKAADDFARETLNVPGAAIEQTRRARNLMYRGDLETASTLLKNVTTQSPTYYLGWFYLGMTYDRLGNVAEAEAAFARAVELDGRYGHKDASVYNTFGYFLYNQERYQEAYDKYKKAVELDPGHATAKEYLLRTKQKLNP